MARRARRQMNSINVVPYIDVMLVLLVIFMVTAPMIQTGTVDLPSVGKNLPTNKKDDKPPLEVIVKANGGLSLKNRAKGDAELTVSREELAEKIREAIQANPELKVLIAGDHEVKYEAVLEVMSELKDQQVAKIGLLVQPGK